MKIVVTGSLGHISKPLTQELVQKGHSVTVISSNPEKQQNIDTLGATAAIGSLEDADFLAATFTGVDAVYTMVPPANYFDHSLDLVAYYHRLGHNYAQAVEQSGVKRVVNLSSIGAHLPQGNGILVGAHDVEQILNKQLPDVAITHMRPTAFYYNLYAYVGMIKNQGFMAANYGADDKIVWVSPIDIAAAVANELETPLVGRNVRYVASAELTCNEVARILGEAVGKPDLTWLLTTNEETQNGLETIGMNPRIASGLVDMQASMHNGVLMEDYYYHKPAIMGNIKLENFASEFAGVFTSK